MIDHLAAFLGLSAVIIITPGPDTVLTIRNTLAGGRAGGIATALGVTFGQATWTLAASAGVASLLVASERAFTVLRLLGAAYLVWLGVRALGAAVWGPGTTASEAPNQVTGRVTPATALRQGLLSNLANPKMVVFFTSLLPQFSRRGEFASLLVLGATFCLMTLVWLAAYAALVARAGDVLLRSRLGRALHGLMGAVLVAFGVRLAAEPR